MSETHILIVEDDPDISAPLAGFLREKGFVTSVCADTKSARAILASNDIDLILLDLMLPGEDGLTFCRQLPPTNRPRIIMLTALSETIDKVIGLELGADDYISKPFDLRELLARIRAVLRREDGTPARQNSEIVLQFSGFAFHPHRRFLRSPSGLRVPLTGAETDLLLIFCQNAQQLLSRQELINLTRGDDFAISARSIDLLVSRLRRKLSVDDRLTDPIRTVRADGYVFQAEVTSG
ncbi:response regulator [Rhizobium sp. NPDC090279]|uniref:response regulator n=1 Tax=Rhizobium sp. NPDC090279 TaxID=3364499 RepID=UPI00383AD589